MTQLQELEEWQAIQTVQPFIHRSLGIASRKLGFTSSNHVYSNSLEHLRLELGNIPVLPSSQILSSDIVGESRSHLKSVLALLEELVDDYSVFQVSSDLAPASCSYEQYVSSSEGVFGDYPTLKRLADFAMTSELNPILFRVGYSESGINFCARAALVIKKANIFFESKSPHSDIHMDTDHIEKMIQPIHTEVDDRIHSLTSMILSDIQQQLSECDSRDPHVTLFTLPGRSEHDAMVSDLELHLLLKSCTRLSREREIWQDATCHYIPAP